MEISELARKRRREEETKWSRRGALRLFAAPSVCLFLTWFICGHAQAADKVTYVDHVQPIFDNHCASCHNPDDKKGGLDLSSFSAVLAGGNSDAVVEPQRADDSLLYKLVTHQATPKMPPKSAKLPDEKLKAIHDWIAGGLLETTSSKARVSDRPKVDLSLGDVSTGKPDGPVAYPKHLLTEPVVVTQRATTITALASSPWAHVTAVGAPRQVLLYDSGTLDMLGVLPFPEGTPMVARFSRNGSLLLVGGGHHGKSGRVVVFDVETGKRMMTVGKEYDAVLAADISPDQSRVVLGGPSKVARLFDTRSGEVEAELRKHTDWITAAAFSPDGILLATADRAGNLFVWEAQSGREFYTLRGHKEAITAVAFRPDSDVLLSASEDGTVRLWDMHQGREVKNWAAHGGGVLFAAYTHGGRVATVGRDHRAKLWAGDGKGLKTYEKLKAMPSRVTFSHDGKRVIAGDWRGGVHVWQTDDGERVGRITPNPPNVATRLAAAKKRLASLEDGYYDALFELDELASKAKKAEKRLVAAAEKHNDATQVLEAHRKTLAAREQALAEAKKLHSSTAKSVARFQKNVEQISNKLNALKKEILAKNEGSERRMQQLREQATKTLAALEEAKKQAEASPDDETLKAKHSEAQAAHEEAAAAYEKFTSSLDQIRDEMANLTNIAQAAMKELETEAGQLKAIDKARTEAAAAQEAADKALKASQSRTDALAQAAQAAESALRQVKTETAPTREDHVRAKAAFARLDGPYRAAERAVARWEAEQINTKRYAAMAVLDEKQQALREAEAAKLDAEEAAAKAEAALASLRKQKTEAPARLAALQEDIDNATRALGEAEDATAVAKRAVDDKSSLVELAAELVNQTKQAADAAKENAQLQEAAKQAVATHKALKADWDAANRQAMAKASVVGEARKQLNAARAAHAAAEKDVEALPERIAEAMARVDEFQTGLSAAVEAYSQAREAAEAQEEAVEQLRVAYEDKLPR